MKIFIDIMMDVVKLYNKAGKIRLIDQCITYCNSKNVIIPYN